MEKNVLFKKLESALKFYVKHGKRKELREQKRYYGVKTLEELIDIMYESYLGVYNDEELKDAIINLYEV